MRLTINVTQEDIDHGKRGDCTRCPIALAVTRELDLSPRDYLRVNGCEVILQLEGEIDSTLSPVQCFSLGVEGQKFVKDFDSPLNLSVEPFSFELEEVTLL
jgi:hypothetical protein